MRGEDQQQNHMFSYLSPEARVRKDHPLRSVRAMVDDVLQQLSRQFDAMYSNRGRGPSIPPEQLLRAHRGAWFRGRRDAGILKHLADVATPAGPTLHQLQDSQLVQITTHSDNNST